MTCTPSDTVKRTAVDLPDGVPPLRQLYFYASGACNLACKHCWITPTFQATGEGGQHLDLDLARRAVEQALPLGLDTVKLTGGEPMLHPRFRELVELVDSHGVAMVMETNGTLVDEELARFLVASPGMGFISISLDGPDAASHESVRMVRGSFDAAVAGVRNLVAAGMPPQLICTVNRHNAPRIGELVALAEQLGVRSVKFNHLQRTGRGERFDDDAGLDVAELIELHRRVDSELVPKTTCQLHFDIPFAFYPIRRLLHGNLGRCGIHTIVGILATGEIALCGIGVSEPELVWGHLATDNLAEVWCSAAGLQSLRELVPARLIGICGQCIHRDFCMGVCPAQNFHASRQLNAANRFCTEASRAGLFPASRRRSIEL